MSECIFCKLANHEIPTNVVYENDLACAFEDAEPQAPVHVLVVPKKHYVNMTDDIPAETLAAMAEAVREVARIKELGGRFLADVRTSGRHLDSVIDGIEGFAIAAGEKREGRRRGTLNVALGAGCKNAALVKNLFELNVNRAIYSTSSSATIIADVRRLFFDGRLNCDLDRFADAIAAISGEAHLPKYSGWRSKYATGHVGIACRTRNFVSFDASLDNTDDALIGRICVKAMEHMNDLGMISVISNVADNMGGFDHDMSKTELTTYSGLIGCAFVSAIDFAIGECESEGCDCSGIRNRMMPHKGGVSAAFDMVEERSYMLDVA